MREGLIAELCSERCAGRMAGSKGGAEARRLIAEALRESGVTPREQHVPGVGGANLLAEIRGDSDRWILLAAHYDHLGTDGGSYYPGADDNAAAVAVLVEVAAALAKKRAQGRGVILAAFDSEEPPNFETASMGSEHFARYPTRPLESIDLAVCLDLIGRPLGPEGLPGELRSTLFALGAERSAGTATHVDQLSRAVDGLTVRRLDAEVVPPLSDYSPFWRRQVPFLFLTGGRSRHYHTSEDTPERLDHGRLRAAADWLERFVRESCARPEAKIPFLRERDDLTTLHTIVDFATAMQERLPAAGRVVDRGRQLLRAYGRSRSLPAGARAEMSLLIATLEKALA